MRHKYTITNGNRTCKVYYNEYEEYVVQLYIDSVHKPNADYFTTDFTDAVNTATHMVNPQ